MKGKEHKKIGLEEFIQEHFDLISVVGIFGALAIFADGIQIGGLNHFLSFSLIGLMVLAWFELWSKFPKNGTDSLLFFENLLLIPILIFPGYWLINYWDLWRQLLFVPIMAILMFVVSKTIKVHNIIGEFEINNIKLNKFFKYLLAIIIGGSVLLVSIASNQLIVYLIERNS